MNILDILKSHTFGVRRSIDVLDPENQPGSGKIRTVSDSKRTSDTEWWKQKIKLLKFSENLPLFEVQSHLAKNRSRNFVS